jgi:hypothetical protein
MSAQLRIDQRARDRTAAGYYRLTFDGRTVAESADCGKLCDMARDLGPGALVVGISDPQRPDAPASSVWYSPR